MHALGIDDVSMEASEPCSCQHKINTDFLFKHNLSMLIYVVIVTGSMPNWPKEKIQGGKEQMCCYSLLLCMYCMVLCTKVDRILYNVHKISNLCTHFSLPFILDTKLITTLQCRYIATFNNASHHFKSEDVSLCDE